MITLARRRPIVPLALAAALLAGVLVLFAPLPASAHDSLVASSPEAGSTVDTLPAELTLTFSAKLIDGEGATEIVVTDADGASVTDGTPTLDGAIVTQPLAEGAAAGEYHVVWKVVSSDGHPTSGEFSFTVATGTAPSEPSAAPTASQSPAPVETATSAPVEDVESAASFSPGWLIAGAVALLVLLFLLALWLRRRRTRDSGSADPSGR